MKRGIRIVTLALRHDIDVVAVRRRAREIAQLLGFATHDQTRIATAVSEVARIAVRGVAEARVEFAINEVPPPSLSITFSGAGEGFDALHSVVEHPDDEAALAIIAAHRLMDATTFATEEEDGWQSFGLVKALPADAPAVTPALLTRIAAELARTDARNPLGELEQQNHELSQTLADLREREEELERLNGELEDTNRGVLALYAELDDRAEHLRVANELKTKFLSYMSHEFRTPLSSILALSRLLLARVDGELTEEQQKQVELIRDSALDLSGTVNDLLDLSKIEAGRLDVRPSEFYVADLFSALRGMLRPLVGDVPVTLVFDEVEPELKMFTDDAKLAQILRNFISNALKFTTDGEVSISAEENGEEITFVVRDSGIGISPDDQERIFEEFSQVDSQLQRRTAGTGLGLPLCRKLATLLGGSVRVESVPGRGSTFSAVIPKTYPAG